jgi:hypothetical protein
MKGLLWLNIVTSALLAATALAGDEVEDASSIHGLYLQCTSTAVPQRMLCLGFLDGIAAGMTAADAVTSQQGYKLNLGWCSDGKISGAQLEQAFKNWHDKHPQHWDKLNSIGVIASIQETWPCTPSTRK